MHGLTILVAILLLALVGCDPAGDGPSDDDDSTADDDDTTADDDDSAADDDDTTGEPTGVTYAYFAVHLDHDSIPVDPASGAPNMNRPRTFWPDLVELVEAADTGGHELTLMFTAQWAYFVLHFVCTVPDDGDADPAYTYHGGAYDTCLALVRAFEAHGHEIALHHHPFEVPAAWDGYTDLESWQADRDLDGVDETYHADGSGPHGPDPHYLGTSADLQALVVAIPASGTVLSATTEEYPAGDLVYESVGGPNPYVGPDDRGDLLGQPCARDASGHPVWQLRMRQYMEAEVQDVVRAEELPAAVTDLAGSPDGAWTAGFVAHPLEVDLTGVAQYTLLFDQLDALGLRLERLADVMAYYPYTGTAPDEAAPEHRCAER